MTAIQSENIEHKVDKIIDLLQGNEFDDDDKGLIGKVNSLETRMRVMEKRDARLIGLIIGLSVPAGAGISNLLASIAEHLK